jgi:hypothetical protein
MSTPKPPPDPASALFHLRAIILRLSHEIDSIAELPARDMRKHLAGMGDRMRALVASAQVKEEREE